MYDFTFPIIDASRRATVLDLADHTTTEVALLLCHVIDAQEKFLETAPPVEQTSADDANAYYIATCWRSDLRYAFERKFFAVS